MGAADTLVVHEIYQSIQGESTFAGLPCVFVRLTGCNLRCSWCDTTEAFKGGTRKPTDEVAAETLSYGTPLVEVTGGEPLLQPGCRSLLSRLCDSGRTVLLETSGERDISVVDPRVHRIVDLKAPGSGESHRNRWENLNHLTERDEIKFVLSGAEDYAWARKTIVEHDLSTRVRHVLMSTVHGSLPPSLLASWILRDKLPVRLQLQLHKFIWSPDAQGV